MGVAVLQSNVILWIMRKQSSQICMKLAPTLRRALELAAAEQSRGLSGYIRKILVDHTAKLIIERGGAADTGGARR